MLSLVSPFLLLYAAPNAKAEAVNRPVAVAYWMTCEGSKLKTAIMMAVVANSDPYIAWK